MPRPGRERKSGGKSSAQRQAEYRAGILLIRLPRRDVHDLYLIRRRLYELTTTPAFVQPMELEFILSVVDSLTRRVENARKTTGFTWNEADAQDGVGPE